MNRARSVAIQELLVVACPVRMNLCARFVRCGDSPLYRYNTGVRPRYVNQGDTAVSSEDEQAGSACPSHIRRLEKRKYLKKKKTIHRNLIKIITKRNPGQVYCFSFERH